jgi:hypothetical protein
MAVECFVDGFDELLEGDECQRLDVCISLKSERRKHYNATKCVFQILA